MPTEILVKQTTPVVWADSTDYSSTNSGLTRTHQILLENLADGAARQGAKADLGATRAARYAVILGVEFETAPTAGLAVEVYWSSSVHATAATGNTGGASGSDGAYKAGEVEEWKKQLLYLGSLVATNDGNTTPQYQQIGEFCPPSRYGQPVVVNRSGQALNATDAVEMFVALIPITDELQ